MSLRFRKYSFVTFILLSLMLAACAPDNLDITPTPTPTNTPQPTATRPPTSTPAPATEAPTSDPNAAAAPTSDAPAEAPTDAPADGDAAAVDGSLYDQLVAAIPEQLDASGTWRQAANETTGEEVTEREEEGGGTFKVYYGQAGGSFAEITIGAFDTPEAAQAYFTLIAERTRTLENAEERDNLPTPNLFAGGLYGQDSLLLQGSVVIRVSVPRFNSNAGDPLGPLMRAMLRIVDGVTGAAQ